MFFQIRYDTLSAFASMCLYFLALNPEVQEKAAAEALGVMASKGDSEGKIDREDINDLKYIEQVINESLRMASFPALVK